MKTKLIRAVIVLGAVADDKVNLVAAVTPDLVEAKASMLVKSLKKWLQSVAEAEAVVRIWRKQAVKMRPS